MLTPLDEVYIIFLLDELVKHQDIYRPIIHALLQNETELYFTMALHSALYTSNKVNV